MKITLNGQSRELAGNVTLQQLIEQSLKTSQRVIVEVNGTIIKNTQWNSLTLRDGDSVELVSFVGGG
jgi:sulfur carrier protein